MYRATILPSNDVITLEEAEYFLEEIPKDIRIGVELEACLPDEQGACSAKKAPALARAWFLGETVKFNTYSSTCRNDKICQQTPHPAVCRIFNAEVLKTGTESPRCEYSRTGDVKSCRKCSFWKRHCQGNGCQFFDPIRKSVSLKEDGDVYPNANTVRRILSRILDPSEVIYRGGKYGVFRIEKDGSLLPNGGVEIILAGKSLSPASLLHSLKVVTDALSRVKATINERCSIHYHLLLAYTEQSGPLYEHPLPSLVLRNLFQIMRIIEVGMVYLSSTLPPPHYTRWAKFRAPLWRIKTSPSDTAPELLRKIKDYGYKDGKYLSTSFRHCIATEDEVSTFHVENRIPDGNLSPTAIYTLAFLPVAALLKAVALSSKGLVQFDCDKAKHNSLVKLAFQGADADWDDDRRAHILDRNLGGLRRSAQWCIDFLSPELKILGCPMDVITALLESPVSVRRETSTWKQIEKELAGLMTEHRVSKLNQILDGLPTETSYQIEEA